jgi:hypothetical protein
MALQIISGSMARLAGAMLLTSALSVLSGSAFAQSTPPSNPPVAQSVGVQTFLTDPGALLRQNPAGGPNLISEIRDLAVATPSTLDAIIHLLANANKDQKTAIASGLAQAAKIVVKNNPQYATQIQLAIADTKDQDVVLAYSAAAGEAPIGAAGGGGAASGGASGGQTSSLFGAPTGTGAAQDIPGGSTPTGQFSYTSAVSGTGGTTTTTGTSSLTTLTISVSP